MEEAKRAAMREEVPIGALLVDENSKIVAANGNRTRELSDPSAHAEILCVRKACEAAGAQRVPGSRLYVTLEPCTMCAAALSFARVQCVVFGASDPKSGGVLHGSRFYDQLTCHHKPIISYGLLEEECSLLLKDFFKARR